MDITSITPLDKRRCKILLDENLVLVLYKGEMRQYQITEGGELSEESYEEIVQTVLCKRARERVIYLLKASDKTEQELRRKLREGFYPEKAIDYAIDLMKRYHYINDEEYAQRYVENHSRKKSRRQICHELKQKGISREIIQTQMEACPEEEEEQVVQFLQKKHYSPDSFSREEKHKMAAALGRKGFSFEVINRVMGEFCDMEG